ncbi:hypothetical protein [Salinicoccus sp. HZC-1]|uniref:hypothetical protein n=1 Tax=Salinicoccus sp. HZC-1 TaxID=3385497 RepID=UPI00398B1215
MIYFIALFYILAILGIVYFLGRNEHKNIRMISLGYFIILTIAFLVSAFLLNLGGGSNAPLLFSYLYVAPFIFFVGYKLMKYIRNYKGWQMIVLALAGIFNLVIIGLILLLIFVYMYEGLMSI